MSNYNGSSPFKAIDLGRSLYCCFFLFAGIVNPIKYLPISAYSKLSLEILIPALVIYPLIVSGQPNFFTFHIRKLSFYSYALLISVVSMTVAVIFKLAEEL